LHEPRISTASAWVASPLGRYHTGPPAGLTLETRSGGATDGVEAVCGVVPGAHPGDRGPCGGRGGGGGRPRSPRRPNHAVLRNPAVLHRRAVPDARADPPGRPARHGAQVATWRGRNLARLGPP